MADPRFLDWCKQHAIRTSKVRSGRVAEGWRGIIATDTIEPDTVIMLVPEPLLMSVMSARRDPQLAAVLQHHQLNSHQVLSIHLLCEAAKGGSSFWHPYIQQLPRQLTTCMAWPEAAIAALQLPYAQEEAAEAVAKARSEWTSARAALQELGLPKQFLSWHGWCWSSSCVLSRTMYHPGDPDTGCLTPLADLHNHQPPPPPHEVQLGYTAQQLRQQHQHHAVPRITQQQQQQPLQSLASKIKAAAGHCASGRLDKPKHDLWSSVEQQVNGSHQTPRKQLTKQNCQEMLPQSLQQQRGLQQQQETTCKSTNDSRADCTASDSTAAAAARTSLDHSFHDDAACVSVTDGNGSSTLGGDGYFDPRDKLYKIVARRRYEVGDQVFLCYGRQTNLDLLQLYGFMLDDNPHDQALLQLEALQDNMQRLLIQRHQQQQGEGRQWKRQQQQQQQEVACHLDLSAADCYVSVKGCPSWELLRALRLAAATTSEARLDGHLAHQGSPISVTSELLVLQCLMITCQQALGMPPTTAADEQALLTDVEEAALAAAHAGCLEATPKADSMKQCQQASQQQRQQLLKAECVQLAVRWRLSYKQSLMKCTKRCKEAFSLLKDTVS